MRAQSVQIFAHAAGARVLWLERAEDDRCCDLRVADFNRRGHAVGSAATIATGIEFFFASASGTDLFVAWHASPESIEALIVDRDREVVARFPVVTMPEATLTSVACTASDCAVAWSLPRFRTTGGSIARFAPNGAAIGAPIPVPQDTNLPRIVDGDGDYLVLLTWYDYGRPAYQYALLRDGEFCCGDWLGSRSVGADATWNGREWLVQNYPMAPYSPFGLVTTRIDAGGKRLGGFAYDRENYVSFYNPAWDGAAWVYAKRVGGSLYAGIVRSDGAVQPPHVPVAGTFDGVSIASAGDGMTWFAYHSSGRVILRRVWISP